MNLLKTVWIKPRFPFIPLHSMYYELAKNPPPNYQILIKTSKVNSQSTFSSKTQNPFLRCIKYELFSIPYVLYQLSYKYKIPENTDLIFAAEHVISSSKPWIIGLEFAGALSGYMNPDHSKFIICKKLKDKQCKFILAYSEWGKSTISNLFSDCDINNKLRIIRYTVFPKKLDRKNTSDSNLKLLFVGTINPGNLLDFEFKGLNEIIEAFNIIQQKFPRTELIIRSKVSTKIKNIIQNFQNIKLIDTHIPNSEMINLYKNSDIFVQVGYGTLTNSVLEAASFGLPIITIDLFNNSEFIKHNYNGLLIKLDDDSGFYDKYGMPNEHSSQFLKSIRKNHDEITKKMVMMLELLIEDEYLRKELGLNAKKSIETGEFSYKECLIKLKKIFDESIEN